MNVLKGWFFADVPKERLAVLRLLVGLYASVFLLIRTPHLLSYGLDNLDRFHPVGLVSLAETPLLPILYQMCVWVTLGLSVAFTLGYRYRVLAPIYAFLLLFVLTHSNSWGKILHTDNMLVLYVIILSLAPAADALSWDERQGRIPASPPARSGKAGANYAWAIRLMAALCGIVYLLAGIAKLRNSGWTFLEGESLRNYIAFDNVRKLELGSLYSPLGAALLPYPGMFTGMAWMALFLEIAAPLAVVHRRFGRLWAWMIWAFHVGVLALMAIGFVFQMSMIAFSPFFDVENLLKTRPGLRLRYFLRLS